MAKAKHKKSTTRRHTRRVVSRNEPIYKNDGTLDLRYNVNRIYQELEVLETYDLLDETYEEYQLEEIQREDLADEIESFESGGVGLYTEPTPEEVAYEAVSEQAFEWDIFKRSLSDEIGFFMTEGNIDHVFVQYGSRRVEIDLLTLEMMRDELSQQYDYDIDQLAKKEGGKKFDRYKAFMVFPTTIDPESNSITIHWDRVVAWERIDLDTSQTFFDHI